MSIALSRNEHRSWRVVGLLPWLGMGVCLAALGVHLALDVAAARARVSRLAEVLNESARTTGPRPEAGSGAPKAATSVSLSASKLKVAGVTTAAARIDELPVELGVAGLIDVNADRRIDIRPRAAGVVREVHVVLGQDVRRGELLVTLDSPEIGTARLNLRAKQRELGTARIEADWKSQIAATVALLIPELRKGTDPSALEKEFGDKPLGSYRGTLLQAYAEFDIAAHEEEKAALLRKQEVQGEHPAVIARHIREGLQAKLYGAIEQVKFDAGQEKRLADQRLRRAEAEVIDAAQRLRILGVSEDIQDLLDHPDRANDVAANEDVTAYRIVSPFDGTVIKKDAVAVASQRAEPTDVLFTVADLSTVWVTANITESDVSSLPKLRGGEIRFSTTAYGPRIFSARLLSIGALVDSQTRTVPILAETRNPDGALRPGMFTRIFLDSPNKERALTVPHSAVVEIEGQSGVFIPSPAGEKSSADHQEFAFRPIKKGREVGDRVIVQEGLKEGEHVVATGAYQLKSELILQNEPEEE
jgi:multidrug efflux pump subunit AcrA (membrane-fusion protein)